MGWRNNVDPFLKPHLERQILESVKYRNSFNRSSNPGLAQLWIAIANLSRDLFDMNLKFDYLERALRETVESKKRDSVEKPTTEKFSRKVKKTKRKE